MYRSRYIYRISLQKSGIQKFVSVCHSLQLEVEFQYLDLDLDRGARFNRWIDAWLLGRRIQSRSNSSILRLNTLPSTPLPSNLQPSTLHLQIFQPQLFESPQPPLFVPWSLLFPLPLRKGENHIVRFADSVNIYLHYNRSFLVEIKLMLLWEYFLSKRISSYKLFDANFYGNIF